MWARIPEQLPPELKLRYLAEKANKHSYRFPSVVAAPCAKKGKAATTLIRWQSEPYDPPPTVIGTIGMTTSQVMRARRAYDLRERQTHKIPQPWYAQQKV